MPKQKKTQDTVATTERRIPHFNSIQEEAEFWDSHDSTEFEDEFEDVDTSDHVGMATLGVFLTDAEREDIEKLAREQNVRPWRIARRWILEGLARESAPKQT